jgi:hypothetical protein
MTVEIWKSHHNFNTHLLSVHLILADFIHARRCRCAPIVASMVLPVVVVGLNYEPLTLS